MARAKARASTLPVLVTALPPSPKPGSSSPFGRYRATANPPKPSVTTPPAATTLPSGWRATAKACALLPEQEAGEHSEDSPGEDAPAPGALKSVTTRPPFPKPGSNVPFGRYRV